MGPGGVWTDPDQLLDQPMRGQQLPPVTILIPVSVLNKASLKPAFWESLSPPSLRSTCRRCRPGASTCLASGSSATRRVDSSSKIKIWHVWITHLKLIWSMIDDQCVMSLKYTLHTYHLILDPTSADRVEHCRTGTPTVCCCCVIKPRIGYL